jgi:phosphatidylglycerophosphate synthase
MLESLFFPRYKKWLIEPILRITLLKKTEPLALTFLATCFGLLTLPLIMLGSKLLAIMTLAFSGYLDSLDGALARAQKKTSSLGAVCDIFSDRVVELCVLLGLYFYEPATRSLGCLLMLGSCYLCITSFLVVGIFSQNDSKKSFYYSPGIMERAEAFVFFGAMIVWPKLFFSLALLFTLLVTLTFSLRLKQFFTQR